MLKNISHVGIGLKDNLHEIRITDDHTVLLAAYQIVPYKLGQANMMTDHFQDYYFQEINLETNELLFNWRASDHLPIQGYLLTLEDDTVPDPVKRDYYRIASVDKDEAGNFLVLCCGAHAIFYIDGNDGHILWTLGGKNNSFTDQRDDIVTSIQRPYHARFVRDSTANMDGKRYIAVVDNSDGARPRRVLTILIDEASMRASLIAEVYHPANNVSTLQGPIQQLNNGNLLINWDFASGAIEYSPTSTEVSCDVQVMPSHPSGMYNSGRHDLRSAFRLQWQGYPLDPPTIEIDETTGRLNLSWNGATEVKKWRLDGLGDLDDPHEASIVYTVQLDKQDYVSSVFFEAMPCRGLRLTALTQEDRMLGSWMLDSSGAAIQEVCVQVFGCERQPS